MRKIFITLVIMVGIAACGFLYLGKPFFAADPSADPARRSRGAAESGLTADPDAAGSVTLAVPPPQGPDSGSSESADQAPLTEEEAWKDRLRGVLTDESIDDRGLGRKLLGIVQDGKAPDWVRVNAMANALNFIDDGNYGADVRPIVIRTDLPEAVYDKVLDDLLSRDPEVVMELAREFDAVGNHPLSGALEDVAGTFAGSDEAESR